MKKILDRLNGQNSRKSLCLTALFLASACGLKDPGSPSGSLSQVSDGESGFIDSDLHLQPLYFSGEVSYKPYGNHTDRYTFSVGDQEHPFGRGPSLLVKTLTAYGACQVFTVYDLKTNSFTWVEPFGNPSCTVRSATMGTSFTAKAGEPSFKSKLTEIYKLLEQTKNADYVSAEDKNKISPIFEHVKSTLYPR